MQVKLLRIANDQFKAAFIKLREQSKQMKAIVSFKFLQSAKVIQEHLVTYDQARLGICEKYATKDENGEFVLSTDPDDPQKAKQYTFDDVAKIDFQREHFDLLQTDVDIPEPKAKISDVGHLDLSIPDLEVLLGVVIVDDAVETERHLSVVS